MRMLAVLSIMLGVVGMSGCFSPSGNEPKIEYLTQEYVNQNQASVDYSAHWLTTNIIVVPQEFNELTATLIRNHNGDWSSISLETIEVLDGRYTQTPHLTTFQALQQVGLSPAEIKQWLKSELFVSFSKAGKISHVTQIQTSQVIDQLYTLGNDDANEVSNFGAVIRDDNIEFTLWAPTAQKVSLLLFNADKSASKPANILMTENKLTGTWQAKTKRKNEDVYYQYQVDVYHPESKKNESIIVTDPYSLSLSVNSEYSHVIDLSDRKNMPIDWETQQDVVVGAPENNIFYETHIRDFSSHEKKLSNEAFRGKYKAFSEQNSDGIKHLKALQQAGLNNIHLLPAFDIGTVNEDINQRIGLDDTIEKICQLLPQHSLCQKVTGADDVVDYNQTLNHYLSQFDGQSDKQQAIISSLREHDNYNWGYDPFHYTVPDGSYALNAEGSARIIEFRAMVQNLHNLGFRVIMDVVYNHTHKAGLANTSVLDKIVPHYYHRLDPITGGIAQSTCCDNTATERVMMAKLMTDSLVVWARDYKIDGFRFDLMGHQPKSAMLAAREAVRVVDNDTYFYGEGWNFGEVANNQRFTQASQLELGGSEIGTYSDRLRDAVRGPGMGASGDDIRRNQGLGNGLVTVPNELSNSPEIVAKNLKNYYLLMDQLRIGLAGNLAKFPLIQANGEPVLGKDIPYGDQPTGYALDPADTINYVSKHDNQTLWDNNQYRNNFALTTDERVRMHVQSLSYVLLAQGIPFLHMGSELLRSKSFLRDSYDYSDWFNRVDFSKLNNFYTMGLPPAEKDEQNWPLINKVLTRNEGRDQVTPKHIQFSSEVFNEFIAMRMSSPLFRLTTANDIINKVSFLNTGKNQQIGLLVMKIDDVNLDGMSDDMANALPSEINAKSIKATTDKNYQGVIVVFNLSSEIKSFAYPAAQGFVLHPLQRNGVDDQVKRSIVNNDGFTVPAFTSAVFVLPRI